MKTKIQSKAVLSLAVLALAVSGAIYAWHVIAPPKELAVYEALLISWGADAARSPLTLMSRPTTCRMGDAFSRVDEELLAAFRRANSDRRDPIQIGSLSRHMDVITYRNAQELRSVENIPNAQGIEIIYLSRVGFSSDGNAALLCVEAPHMATAIVLRRGEQWYVVSYHSIWVS